jgi:hypothetical protein
MDTDHASDARKQDNVALPDGPQILPAWPRYSSMSPIPTGLDLDEACEWNAWK